MSKLRPPFTLFQRHEGGPYWVRFSIQGQGQIRKALDTTDPLEAQHKAMQVWGEAKGRDAAGLTVRKHSVKAVVEDWCRQLDLEVSRGDENEHKARQYKGIAIRYIVAFWGDKPIDTINEVTIYRFWEWRYDYWTTGPGKDIKFLTYMWAGRQIRRPVSDSQRAKPAPSTLGTEIVVLRFFLKYARRSGLIKEMPEIEVRRTGKPNARPSFSSEELGRLQELSLQRLAGEKHAAVRRDRLILHCWICILAYSGMRPTEAIRLTWGDVIGYEANRTRPMQERDIQLRVYGKGKSRTFPPKHAVIPWFDKLWDQFRLDLGRNPLPNDPVFCDDNGRRLSSVKKGFNELLEAAGLKTDYRGVSRTSYSFRHFFISQQLIAGVSIFDLAQMCGTSPDMVNNFYADVSISAIKDKLRPEWR